MHGLSRGAADAYSRVSVTWANRSKPAKGFQMKAMTCPCGEALTGETDQEFIDSVNKHFETAHPEMAGKYTSEQILSRAQEV
jgi:hypothetical protein